MNIKNEKYIILDSLEGDIIREDISENSTFMKELEDYLFDVIDELDPDIEGDNEFIVFQITV